MKLNLTICFLILCFVLFSKAQDSTKYFILSSPTPTVSNKDLKQLNNYFNNVKIVGMGESTHGTHEFFTMRHKMFKYLVEEHGFNTYFLEADYANCLRANDYIHGKEDNAEDVVKEFGLWPWKVKEMVDLVDWMRAYNENHNNQLNLVGVDMQFYVETLKKMDDILLRYHLPVTDSIIYQKMLNENFISLKKKKDLKVYKEELERKKNIDVSLLNTIDKKIYDNLLRHLTQIVGEKYRFELEDYRDYRMAENILYHLGQNDTVKGFFQAHNGHLIKGVKQSKRKKIMIGLAGGVLKYELKDRCFIIGQDFDEGYFNAYHPAKDSAKIIEGKPYVLGKIEVSKSIKGSIPSNYRHLDSPIFIDCSSFAENETVYMNFISAVYSPDNGKSKKTSRFLHHGRDAFDAIILIKKSTPTELLRLKNEN
jgi:erythromycin esterase